jgi:PTS system beta-glucosides-specific IIC component
MDYKKTAAEILPLIGGKENILSLVHCATRLRFSLADGEAFQAEELKKVKGVMGAMFTGGQYQVIIGTDVNHVYDNLLHMTGLEGGSVEIVEQADLKNGGSGNGSGKMAKAMDIISSLFTPAIAAITGAAMIKVVLVILTMTGLMDASGQTYQMFSMVGDAPFYFMPVILAYTSSVKFGVDPMVGLTIGLCMVHPTYLSLIDAGEAVRMFGLLPVNLAKYTSTVLPVILVIYVASWVQKLAEKLSPKVIRFFFKPLLTLIIMTPLTFCIVGPLSNLCGKVLEGGLSIVQVNAPWFLPIFFGAFGPIVIMLGMHYAVTIPLALAAIQAFGYDMLGPGFLVANIAQGAAALAVAVLAKDKDFKSLATSTGVSAILGTTEPALYGVNLRLKKPLYASILGGLIGGIICGIAGVKRIVFGPTGLTSIAIFIDPDNGMNFVFALIGVAATFAATFVITYALVRKDRGILKEIGQ